MKYFYLCFILAVFSLLNSCSSKPQFENQNQMPPLRTPANDSWQEYRFDERLRFAIDFFRIASQKMLTQSDPTQTLLKHFVRRASNLSEEMNKSAGSFYEFKRLWFPTDLTEEARLKLLQIIAYKKVIYDLTTVLSASIILPTQPPEAFDSLNNGLRAFQEIETEMNLRYGAEILTDKILFSAKVDLVATLAGQMYRAMSSEVITNRPTRDQLRSTLRELNNFPRLNSRNQGKNITQKLKTIFWGPAWKLVQKHCQQVDLPESSDIEGGERAFEIATTLQFNFEMISFLVQGLDRAPASFVLIPPSDGALLREPQAEASRNRKPAKPKPSSEELVVIGWIPGQYLKENKNQVYFGAITIKQRRISSLTKLEPAKLSDFTKSLGTKKYIVLLDEVLYPGLINLHNHTKQNNLGVWSQARGQFENRFEWRDWGNYKFAVSGNMNPWIGWGEPVECAAFRWSELQAMVWGTTYLQGPSSCVNQFAIQRVEDSASYVSKKAAVQAPTDLVFPNEMSFVWNELRPEILKLQGEKDPDAYEKALAQSILKYCPGIEDIDATTVNTEKGLKRLKDQAYLKSKCTVTPLPEQFIRYVYWIHPTIAGKKTYIKSEQHSAIIAHLAEGRRKDHYNSKEFEIIKLLGLDLPNVNFVHGVGIPDEEFPHLASQRIGLVWSPFSNLLLYSETLNIEAAYKAGVKIALGSDWVPTGSKSPLEEVKFAREYIFRTGLDHIFSKEYFPGGDEETTVDEILFKMMTSYPALMINHAENSQHEAPVGTLVEGAMGTLIAVSKHNGNPFSNLVQKAFEKDINLVVVDGTVVYGNENHLKALQIPANNYEILSPELNGSEGLLKQADIPKTPAGDTAEQISTHLITLAKIAQQFPYSIRNTCNFQKPKAFVYQNSLALEQALSDFRDKSKLGPETEGLNLDRFQSLQRLLSISLLTQNRNLTDPQDGKKEMAIKEFPSLYSCNNPEHQRRISQFVTGADEWSQNNSQRADNRKGLGKGPAALAEKYKD